MSITKDYICPNYEGWGLRLVITQTPNIAGNTSALSIVYYAKGNWTGAVWANATLTFGYGESWAVSVALSDLYSTQTGEVDAWRRLGSLTTTISAVPHNSDGTKSFTLRFAGKDYTNPQIHALSGTNHVLRDTGETDTIVLAAIDRGVIRIGTANGVVVGQVYIGNSSGVPVRGIVYIGDSNSVPQVGK